ncbi:MAG: response regulator transcription factor [Anaerolineales bacterium]|nr:response regulator transcription factor [Anaerolineales bacterium]MCB9004625.1 response regulator transcription factor [Ardenticatenaceae bacterium]
MSKLRVILVADDPLARAGLAMLLANQPDIELVDQASSADVLVINDVQPPQAIIWDMGWEPAVDLPNWEAWDTPVIALLAHEDDAEAAWRAGARALLSREMDVDKLATAVHATTHGFIVLDPTFGSVMLSDFAEGETAVPDQPLREALTPRENEVLQLLAEGLTNKAIAQKLDISDHTVKFHVNAIMSKLNAQSRTEAVVRATRLGLILL